MQKFLNKNWIMQIVLPIFTDSILKKNSCISKIIWIASLDRKNKKCELNCAFLGRPHMWTYSKCWKDRNKKKFIMQSFWMLWNERKPVFLQKSLFYVLNLVHFAANILFWSENLKHKQYSKISDVQFFRCHWLLNRYWTI